jgi:predicted DsbA family dithiol-disulfide isomerase
MKSKAIFYHAGCPVCVSAEQSVAAAIDSNKYDLEIVHFGNARDRIAEAEKYGVQSVPALVLDGGVFHINFGASMADVKG